MTEEQFLDDLVQNVADKRIHPHWLSSVQPCSKLCKVGSASTSEIYSYTAEHTTSAVPSNNSNSNSGVWRYATGVFNACAATVCVSLMLVACCAYAHARVCALKCTCASLQ
jgi:hypothetical protein